MYSFKQLFASDSLQTGSHLALLCIHVSLSRLLGRMLSVGWPLAGQQVITASGRELQPVKIPVQEGQLEST